MKNTEKIYIGKGTQVQNYDLYNVTLNISKAEALIFEHNGEKFIKFTLAKTIKPDQYGKTHTAYITPFVAKTSPIVEDSKTPKPKRAYNKKSSATPAMIEEDSFRPTFLNH